MQNSISPLYVEALRRLINGDTVSPLADGDWGINPETGKLFKNKGRAERELRKQIHMLRNQGLSPVKLQDRLEEAQKALGAAKPEQAQEMASV